MAPGSYSMKIYQGDSLSLSIAITDAAGAAVNLSGFTAKSQIRASASATDVILELTCAIPAPTTGVIQVSATAAQTALLTPGKCVYDLQYTDGTNVTTVIKGAVTVTQQVTR